MKRFILLSTAVVMLACDSQKQPQQLPPQDIPVIQVQQKDVPIYNEMVGQVYGLKDIPIRARVDGYLEKISFEEGSRVKKGQLLYSIDPEPFKAEVAAQESMVAEAQTMKVNAKNELERYKPLAAMDAVSQSDLDAAQASYDAAVASEQAAKANLKQAKIKLGYCTIEAPIGGLIGKTEAREGEYVGRDPNPVILNTLSRIDTVRVQFSISESKYLEIARAFRQDKTAEEISKDVDEGNVQPHVELILSDGMVYEEKGTVDFINSQVNSTTGSLLIQASFPNSSRLLRPGMYAKVRLQLATAKGALIIPQRCLIELQGAYSVMVVNADGVVESKPITLGTKVGDMVIVQEGLNANDQVVVDAIQKVAPGQTVNPQQADFKSKTVN